MVFVVVVFFVMSDIFAERNNANRQFNRRLNKESSWFGHQLHRRRPAEALVSGLVYRTGHIGQRHRRSAEAVETTADVEDVQTKTVAVTGSSEDDSGFADGVGEDRRFRVAAGVEADADNVDPDTRGNTE